MWAAMRRRDRVSAGDGTGGGQAMCGRGGPGRPSAAARAAGPVSGGALRSVTFQRPRRALQELVLAQQRAVAALGRVQRVHVQHALRRRHEQARRARHAATHAYIDRRPAVPSA